MTKEQALHRFWSSFGLKAYEENAVPEGTQFPYITYQVVENGFGEPTTLTASLWYRSTSWLEPFNKKDEITDKIDNGISLNYDCGLLLLFKGSPYMQTMGDPMDDLIKRVIFNLSAQFI